MKLSAISAAIAVPITLTYAQQYSVANFVLFGAQDSTGAYPNYTYGTVVDTVPGHITNPLVVVSIEATTQPQPYFCTFIGADGSNTTLGEIADVDPPQAQISLQCSS